MDLMFRSAGLSGLVWVSVDDAKARHLVRPRSVDVETARVLRGLAVKVGASRDALDAERRLTVLIVEARHRAHCRQPEPVGS